MVDEKTPPQEIALSVGGMIAGTVTTTAGAPVKGDIMLRGPDIGSSQQDQRNGPVLFQAHADRRSRLGHALRAAPGRTSCWDRTSTRRTSFSSSAEVAAFAAPSGACDRTAQETFVSLHPKSGSPHFSAEVDEQGA